MKPKYPDVKLFVDERWSQAELAKHACDAMRRAQLSPIKISTMRKLLLGARDMRVAIGIVSGWLTVTKSEQSV